VTVYPDRGAPAVVRTVTVPAETVQSFDRSSLTPEAGPIVVEPFSPDVMVEAGVETRDALDSVPCATTAARHWYFAAGTTVRGVLASLVLDDPFSADARVDVTLRTDSGLQQLPSLQGIDVPGRSRVVIALDRQAVRQARVAVEVHATVGRVVAAQTLQFGPASGSLGVASALGALAPSDQWWFGDGKVLPGASQWVAITDMSEVEAQVSVQALIGSGIVNPVVAKVAPGAVSWVQIGNCTRTATDCLRVPSQNGYEITLHSDSHLPIVAQTLSRYTKPKVALGAATSMGSTAPAREWVIARVRAVDERSTSITLTNPSVRFTAHVDVAVVHDGVTDRPGDLQHLTIAPSARSVLPPAAFATGRSDGAVVISSDQPVFAESTILTARDATRAAGIPTR
jgi:Family of unknown function (DUF5719)